MTYGELLAENQALRQLIDEKEKAYKSELLSLQTQLSQLYKLINGFKSERFVGAIALEQLSLFSQEPVQPPEETSKETLTYTREKKTHPGRHSLPEHLPVVEVIIEPEEDTTGLKKIGQEITETLEYTPASLVKKRSIRPKYVKADGQGILIGELPTRAVEKSIAEASLLSHILVSKYVDHLPFYRQMQLFKRDFGWEVAKSTLSGWMDACCMLLEPLYNTLKQKILHSDYIQVDESPIKVLDSDKKGTTHQGYQWVYHEPLTKLVLFNYRKGRGQHGPKELLAHYKGYLQCDGYSVYDKIGADPQITLVGCLAHVRRKFHDALNNDKTRAEKALSIFREIYLKARKIKAQTQDDFDKTKQLRIATIKPLLEQIRDWIIEEQFNVLPKSTMGKAMSYFNNQYPKLQVIFEDGRMELDNNLVENAIRPLALGRKNYLFAGSHRAAQNAAMIYSFLGSCKMQNINPREWLQNTLEKIPEHSIQKLEQLLPGYQENLNP